jgi:hypothetical protein
MPGPASPASLSELKRTATLEAMRFERQLSDWLARDPRARKWMSACLSCGRVGMRADAPPRFFSRYWLEQLGLLHLADGGRCKQCAQAAARSDVPVQP